MINFIKEYLIQKMETVTKESLKIINLMVKEFTYINVEINIKALFQMGKRMDKEGLNILMETIIKESFIKI